MIAEKYLIKKYWAITKTVPDPAEGIIKIPLGPRLIGGRYKVGRSKFKHVFIKEAEKQC